MIIVRNLAEPSAAALCTSLCDSGVDGKLSARIAPVGRAVSHFGNFELDRRERPNLALIQDMVGIFQDGSQKACRVRRQQNGRVVREHVFVFMACQSPSILTIDARDRICNRDVDASRAYDVA